MTSADVLIIGASAFVGGESRARVAVAVADGRIVALGGEDEIGGLAGPRTRTVNAPGGLVVAGFQDAHIHPAEGGLVRIRCNLEELPGVGSYAEAIRAYAVARPDVPWILGGGWAQPHFERGCPPKELLDDLVADRPVFLTNRDGHGAWVNSRALELAGITGETPDPSDGRIERTASGEPQGTLHEGAMDLVEDLIPPPTQAMIEGALLDAQAYLHSLGVTAWQDAWVTERSLRAYRALAERGELTARVVTALWWDRHRGDEQVSELLELRNWGSTGRLRATSVKIMQDGISENFTAGMSKAYLEPEGRTGLSFIEPMRLRSIVTRLDREGFQVHVHAIGDRAIREALDAFEAARDSNGANDHRHHIAHLQVVDPRDIWRFRKLRVTANAQPFWACLDDQMRVLVLPFIGPELAIHQYPFASLLRSRATLAMGSDWNVTTPDVMKEIQVAVTRVPFDEPEREPFLPGERLTLAQALHAFTAGSAFVNHMDHQTGTLDVGKLADLVVLDRDPFGGRAEEIGSVRPILTLVDGEVVFAHDTLDLD